MAGNGSRFSSAGYKDIKPLIEFLGKPMIQHVIDSVQLEGNYIFVVQKDHLERYDLLQILRKISPSCNVVDTGKTGVTEGAACSVLCAEHYIDPEAPLVIINSDNIISWNVEDYLHMLENNLDGLILCFNDTNPKWSFVRQENSLALEVAEKNPISDIATAGIYIWAKGKYFIDAAKQMIEKNIRVNNEFYICPVYNENIEMKHKIGIAYVNHMHGVGTPEDLKAYVSMFNE
jgi:dTDP-glucose pyrophosphorylase